MVPHKILLVQQNWLGDVLFATPAIRAVRKKYPQAYIACLVPPRAAAVLQNNPHINEVIVCGDRLSFLSILFWKTVGSLRAQQFDAAIFFHRSKTRVWLACLGGIRERWGYARLGRTTLLTKAIELPKALSHKIDHFLHLVERLGIPPDGRRTEFVPKDGASAELEKIFSRSGLLASEPYAVVHAGGNWNLKRWPSEYFAQWIYLFLEQYGGKVILCGTSGEEVLAKKILSKFPDGQVVSFCGKTSLDALALLLKGAKLFLSNDSGPIHLAASQKTRLIGLFGPTSAAETGPVSEGLVKILQIDVGCRVPCYFESCNYRVCMDFLLPKEVFRQTQIFMNTP